MAVSCVAALLRHRALGLANDGGLPVGARPTADTKFGAAHQMLDDWPPEFMAGRAVARNERVVIDHGCNPSSADLVARCPANSWRPKEVDLATFPFTFV